MTIAADGIITRSQFTSQFIVLKKQQEDIKNELKLIKDFEGILGTYLGNTFDAIERIETLLKPKPVARITLTPIEETMANFPIGDNQFQLFAVGFLDAAGNPTTDANALTATSSNPAMATADIVAGTTPPQLRIAAVKGGGVGTVQVTVSDGTINAVAGIDIVGGVVASLVLTPVGPPQDLP